jgi:hypothetical protein
MRLLRLAIAGALGSALLTCSCCLPARAGTAGAPAVEPRARDGSRDFDFLYGTVWLVHNRRLKGSVVSSHDWAQYEASDEARPLPGGLGDEDFFRSNYPVKGFVGMTVRLYDRATGLWRIYWIDNLKSHGDAGEPNVGRWQGNVGIFDEHLTVQGKPAIDRYTWTRPDKPSKVVGHFVESLSFDGGRTWKVIYVADVVRPSGDGGVVGRHGRGNGVA